MLLQDAARGARSAILGGMGEFYRNPVIYDGSETSLQTLRIMQILWFGGAGGCRSPRWSYGENPLLPPLGGMGGKQTGMEARLAIYGANEGNRTGTGVRSATYWGMGGNRTGVPLQDAARGARFAFEGMR